MVKRYADQASGTEAEAGRRTDKKTDAATREKLYRIDRAARRRMGYTERTPGRPRNRKPLGLTGAQRVKLWKTEAFLALDTRWAASPLYDGRARPVRSVASRLRELELHPERLDAIRARP